MEKQPPKTNSERQRLLKARRKANGFNELAEWVHDDDREAFKNYAKRLRAARFKALGIEL